MASSERVRRFSAALSVTVLLLSTVFVVAQGFPATSADLSTTPSANSWRAALHLTSNAYFPWREDPVILFLGGIFGSVPEFNDLLRPSFYFWSACAVYLFSCLTCCLVTGMRPLEGGVIAVASTLVAVIFLGADQAAFAALAWWPALAGCVLASCTFSSQHTSRPTGPLIVLGLFFSYRCAVAGGALSLVLVPLALLLPYLIGQRLQHAYLWCAATLTGPIVVALTVVPALSTPDYPAFGRVVPDDGVPGIVRPLVGPDLSVVTLDRMAVRDELLLVGLLILGLAVIARIGLRPQLRGLWCAISALALCAILDTAPEESIAITMPAESLRRIVPGLFYHYLTPLLVVVAASLLCLMLALQRRLLSVTALVVTGIFVWHVHSLSSPTPHGLLERPSAVALRNMFSLPYCSNSSQAMVRCRDIAASPSFAVVRNYGGLSLRAPVAISSRSVRLPASIVGVSHNQGATHLAADADPTTRWSAQRGRQFGDEWVLLKSTKSNPPIGIALNTGNFRSDFPAALQVLAAPPQLPCSTTALRNAAWMVVFATDSWQGALSITPNGYPFYRGEEQVEIPFPGPVESSCYLVRQVGKRHSFDWSIAEAKFIYAKERSLADEDAGQFLALRLPLG